MLHGVSLWLCIACRFYVKLGQLYANCLIRLCSCSCCNPHPIVLVLHSWNPCLQVVLVPGSVEQRGTDPEEAMRGREPFRRPARADGGAPVLLLAQLDRDCLEQLELRVCAQPAAGEGGTIEALLSELAGSGCTGCNGRVSGSGGGGQLVLARMDVSAVWRMRGEHQQAVVLQDVALQCLACAAHLLDEGGEPCNALQTALHELCGIYSPKSFGHWLIIIWQMANG